MTISLKQRKTARKSAENRKNIPTTLKQVDRMRAMMLAQPVTVKTGSSVPWGYRIDPNNPKMLDPIDDHFKLLLEAKNYLKTCSYTEVADWLSAKTGRKISDEGLTRILHKRHPLPECALPREVRFKL